MAACKAGKRSLSQNYTCSQLTPAHFAWLRSLPDTTVVGDELFVCHGDLFDTPYLLEEVTPCGVCMRRAPAIATSVGKIAQPIILSGHSHIPRTVSVSDGRLLINPGSVGMPAYSEETYVMESDSPHARYVLLHQTPHGWQVEHVQVPYAWEQAAQVARAHHRADWAQWLTTGRAELRSEI